MPNNPQNRQSVEELNALRKRAVEARLAGSTLAETQELVGLSAPTIIAAMKSFRSGGWEAVEVGRRGRPRLENTAGDQSELRWALLRHVESDSQASEKKVKLWDTEAVIEWLSDQDISVSRSTMQNWMRNWSLQPDSRYAKFRQSDTQSSATSNWALEHGQFARKARRNKKQIYWISVRRLDSDRYQLFAHDLRGHALWIITRGKPSPTHLQLFMQALMDRSESGVALVLNSRHVLSDEKVAHWLAESNTPTLVVDDQNKVTKPAEKALPMRSSSDTAELKKSPSGTSSLTHLQRLEAESIHVMREVIAEAENPVMLYSMGKDSSVLMHIARKAFFPAPPPFPLLHIDTGWKFRAMYEFRDAIPHEYGMELITHINQEGLRQKVNPFTHGSSIHTDIMKTQGLKQALDEHRFDVAFGGARRDEEKSRAKERIFSFRNSQHYWDIKNQRPELWHLYNARKQREESIRVFPLSNWTELDIWQYILKEEIPIVPLYLAAERPVVVRDGSLIMVDDERMPMKQGEVPENRSVRFRTLGCYPLTGAVESNADSVESIIQELIVARTSERQGRMIDHDSAASMELKKQEGYF